MLEVLTQALKIASFVYIIPTLTLVNICTITNNRLILKRNSKYNKHLVKNLKITRKSDIEKLKNKINKDKVKILLPYLEELEKNTNEDNLYTVYKNLKNVNIKKNIFILLTASSGTYQSSNNTIEIISKSSLGHEFLHLASSYYNSKYGLDISGFEQYSNFDKTVIGTGLNEGYTELLNSRLYNHNKIDRYKHVVKIANLFEFFFDNNKDMEKYYFNHDLSGFIDYMEQFANRETIINLLLDIDSVYRLIEPMKTYYSVKIQLQLLKIFRDKDKNSPKLEEFQKLVYKNKLIQLLLKGETLNNEIARR